MGKLLSYLLVMLLSFASYATSSVDGYWNAPGVTVTQPHVWGNPGVMVTDTLGRLAPMSASQPCVLVRQCFETGNCVQRQVCDRRR
jgi:hypothetical protein